MVAPSGLSAYPSRTVAQAVPKTPICLPMISPRAIPRGTGPARADVSSPAKETPALAKPKTGTTPYPAQGWIVCSKACRRECGSSGRPSAGRVGSSAPRQRLPVAAVFRADCRSVEQAGGGNAMRAGMMGRRGFLLTSGALALAALGSLHAQGAPPPGEKTGQGTRTRLVLLGTKGGPRVGGARSNPANLLMVGEVPYVIDCGMGVTRQLV